MGRSVRPLTILLAGDSYAAKYAEDFTGPSNSRVTVSVNGTTFTALGTTGEGATNLGDALVSSLNRPVRFINKAASGTTLAQWLAGASTQRAAATAAALAAGGVDYIFWNAGRNDADAEIVVSQAQHETDVRALFALFRTELSKPTQRIVMNGAPRIVTVNATKLAQMAQVRAGEMNVCDDTDVRFGAHSYDLTLDVDDIHLAQGQYVIHASRVAPQIIAWERGSTQARGPHITAATAIDSVTTDLTLAHRGAGSDFTPTSAITGIEISADDFATTLTISAAVRTDSATIRLTHGAGATPRKVRYMYAGNPDITGTIKDNSSLASPADPTPSSLESNTLPVTYGPELIVNGTFDTDFTGWVSVGGGCAVVSGKANLTGSGATATFDQSFATEIGATYQAAIDIDQTGASGTIYRFGTAQGGSTLINTTHTTTGTKGAMFVATSTTTWLRLRRATADAGTDIIDNVSVRKVT